MPEFITTDQAASHIKDGAMIGINAFLTQINPVGLTTAIARRFQAEGHPRELEFYCSAGYGVWDAGHPAEAFVRSGAVKSVTASFFSSSPDTARLIMAGELEGYNLPFGVMCHSIRSAAGGHDFMISSVGRNLFVEPEVGGSKMNAISKKDWVSSAHIDGKHYLKYRTPKFDAVFIKGSSADKYGNISFEDENLVLDALTMAQAARASKGLVIVQVNSIIEEKKRPWDVIIPGSLVDYICVEPAPQIIGLEGSNPIYSGDVFIAPENVPNYMEKGGKNAQAARRIVCRRAARELRPGQLVNLGVGMPEGISAVAAENGLINEIVLTVESGSMGGMPVSGAAFGATVGAMGIIETGQMFDLYDAGSLDVAFIGFLEVDRDGNVNGHYNPKKLSGIGGFADITQSTPKVVFCGTFTAGGLEVEEKDGRVHIIQEGRYPKFLNEVAAVSFSPINSRAKGQEILFVTERCVFRLGDKGLVLSEVYDGIDMQTDILDLLPFEVGVELTKQETGGSKNALD